MDYTERIEAIAKEMQSNCELVVNTHNLNTIFIPAASIAVAEVVIILEPLLRTIFIKEGHEPKQIAIMVDQALKELALIPIAQQYKTAPAGQQEIK